MFFVKCCFVSNFNAVVVRIEPHQLCHFFEQFILGCFFEAKLESFAGSVYICADLCQFVPFCVELCVES